jgi:hypothetical protein
VRPDWMPAWMEPVARTIDVEHVKAASIHFCCNAVSSRHGQTTRLRGDDGPQLLPRSPHRP